MLPSEYKEEIIFGSRKQTQRNARTRTEQRMKNTIRSPQSTRRDGDFTTTT